ncbi:acyltransferase [Methanobrevibacter sp.]|uniref:acyltransferase n=1 Tax=Methanobrevibacter sp. TaxID=66852 RepID=UPI0038900A68
MATKNKRYLSYDILRLMAILGVIGAHLSAFFVLNYNPDTIEFITENIINVLLSAFPISVFLMISGALLLNEDKPFDDKKFIRKSWLPLVLITIFWTVFYGLFYGYGLPTLTHQPTSFSTFLNYLICFEGSDYPHMWYMYMIVGMYLLIPILRLFVKRENRNYILWIIIGCFVVQCIPKTLGIFTIGADFTVKDFVAQFYLNPLMRMIIFLFLGWYLSTFQLAKNKRIIIYILGIISAFVMLWAVQTYIVAIPSIRNYFLTGEDITSTLYSIAIFVFVLAICKNKENDSPKLKELSTFIFGIYLVHVFFLELFLQVIYPYSKFTLQIPVVYHMIIFIAVFALSYIIILLFSKTKYLKKLFYLK